MDTRVVINIKCEVCGKERTASLAFKDRGTTVTGDFVCDRLCKKCNEFTPHLRA